VKLPRLGTIVFCARKVVRSKIMGRFGARSVWRTHACSFASAPGDRTAVRWNPGASCCEARGVYCTKSYCSILKHQGFPKRAGRHHTAWRHEGLCKHHVSTLLKLIVWVPTATSYIERMHNPSNQRVINRGCCHLHRDHISQCPLPPANQPGQHVHNPIACRLQVVRTA